MEQFPANRLGLFDLHGNVWEWCLDDWHSSYHRAPEDGRAWVESQGLSRGERAEWKDGTLRGGSWYVAPWSCRSTSRDTKNPGIHREHVGFRVCCLPKGPSPSP